MNQLIVSGGSAGFGVLRLIRDLFAEVVAFAEHFAADVDDVFGVRIVFRENQCLGNNERPGNNSGNGVTKRLKHSSDLVFNDDGAIELFCAVGEIVIESFPSNSPCFFVAFVDIQTFFDLLPPCSVTSVRMR